jgi:putative ABC transport system ATP-binding protein
LFAEPASGRRVPGSAEPVIQARGLTRVFRTAAGELRACDGVDVAAAPGELVVIRGRSGSGKTTLLGLLGGLDRPTAGQVLVQGRDLAELSDQQVSELRRGTLGYIFQSFGLLPMLSAAENVEVPLRALRTPPAERDARVAEVLELVGLAGHAAQRPYELSGGQQQRVAIARALAPRPQILLADEPTGQLDSETAFRVMDLIGALVQTQGIAAVVTTHFAPMMQRATRLLVMHDGRLSEQEPARGRHAASAV